MRRVENQSIELALTDEGMIVGRSRRPDLQLSYDAVIEIMGMIRDLAGGEVRPGLWDSREMPPPIPEGWHAFIEGIPTLFSALAVVVSPTSAGYLAPYQGVIGSLLMPFEVFGDEDSAMTWLREIQARMQDSDPT